MEKIIVTFTSYPERIWTVNKVLDSIIKQTILPYKIILYLSSTEFLNFGSIPDFEQYKKYGFEIHWYEENLKSHKKWFYAFQEYSNDLIVTIDDDIIYQDTMLETLLKYHERFPECVIARNAKLITCNEEGYPAPYEKWCCWCNEYVGVPRMDLMAIGNGGILYPKNFHSNIELYHKEKFMEICGHADDIWMKIMEVYCEISVVLAEKFWTDTVLMEHQKKCLYENYNKDGGNDRQLRAVFKEYPYTYQKKKLAECIFLVDKIFYGEKEVIEGNGMEKVLEELKKKIEDCGEILVYGAGELGNRIFYLFEKPFVNIIKAFVVNQLKDNVDMIENLPVKDYRDYIHGNEKIVIALLDDNEVLKVCSNLIKEGIHSDRIIILKSFEKRAIMHKIQIPFQSGRYWQKRYAKGGNSGSGSYGRLADFKAEVINKFVKENAIKEVIEWGCGDGNQLKLAQYPIYIGYNVSQKSIELCKKIFSEDNTKSFFCCADSDFNCMIKGDLALSLDVIYHLLEDEIYEQYMRRLFSSSKKYVCIYSSNFEQKFTVHVKHRKFTDWIDKNKKGQWKLLKIIYNRYPYEENSPDDTSWSDFYFYQKI